MDRHRTYSDEEISLVVIKVSLSRAFINRIAAMPLATFHRGAATPLHASQMRWLFVGEALVLRKARRISLCS